MKDSIDIKRLQAPKNENCRKQLVPPWLNVINNVVFFNTCVLHPDMKKNELDHFCIDCLRSLCSNCLPAHMSHKHIKIRRYIYSDVINRQDLCKLFNCSGIQTYHTNKAKVVFLKQRRQSVEKQQYNYNNSKEYRCIICDRALQDNSRYCSIACKVLALCGEASVQDDDENLLPKRPKLKRKGVPLRAPMF